MEFVTFDRKAPSTGNAVDALVRKLNESIRRDTEAQIRDEEELKMAMQLSLEEQERRRHTVTHARSMRSSWCSEEQRRTLPALTHSLPVSNFVNHFLMCVEIDFRVKSGANKDINWPSSSSSPSELFQEADFHERNLHLSFFAVLVKMIYGWKCLIIN